MAGFDYFYRKVPHAQWIMVARQDVPNDMADLAERGLLAVDRKGYYKARPRVASTAEILTAANELAQALTKARKNGDLTHPATQLDIERAHDAFLALTDSERLPPLLSDTTARRRWRPLRCW